MRVLFAFVVGRPLQVTRSFVFDDTDESSNHGNGGHGCNHGLSLGDEVLQPDQLHFRQLERAPLEFAQLERTELLPAQPTRDPPSTPPFPPACGLR